MGRLRTLPVAAGLATAALVAVAVISRLQDSPFDPRVNGRCLSGWFRDLDEHQGVQLEHRRGVDPRLEAALAAFREADTNALPFLLRTALAVDADSPWTDLLRTLSRFMPRRLGFERAEPWELEERARDVLGHLNLPASELLPRLEPWTTHTNASLRNRALMCVGRVGPGKDEAARYLRGFLHPSDMPAALGATQALLGLGGAVTNVAAELVVLAADRRRISWLPELLGLCGPAAAGALPGLEEQWDRETDAGTRVYLALAINRIQPGHPRAWPFLQSVARGELKTSDPRIKPLHLVNNLQRANPRDAALSPFLLEILAGETNASSTLADSATRALAAIDPAACDRHFRRQIEQAGTAHAAVYAAWRLASLQPTNEHAFSILLPATRTNNSAGKLAGWALTETPRYADEARAAIRRELDDPRIHRVVRQQLKSRLKGLAERDRVPRRPDPTDAQARISSMTRP